MQGTHDGRAHLEWLDKLLRGEMAAIETYRQAIDAVEEDHAAAEDLRSLRRDHRDAADALWHHLEAHGLEPSHGSGAWGTFAQAVEGAARLLGNKAAIKALKEGEELGLENYEEALRAGLPADCESLIRDRLLPRQRSHLPVIDRLLQQN